MQVAALADIHGNIQALDAVLADPRLPEQVLVLGDVVAGTFPTECYDRLAELGERARILRGNGGRIVLERAGEEAVWVYDRLGSAGASAGRTKDAQVPTWALLGPEVELIRTDYDVQAAAAAVLRSGQPRALEVVDTLLNPPSPDDAAAEFEAMRGG